MTDLKEKKFSKQQKHVRIFSRRCFCDSFQSLLLCVWRTTTYRRPLLVRRARNRAPKVVNLVIDLLVNRTQTNAERLVCHVCQRLLCVQNLCGLCRTVKLPIHHECAALRSKNCGMRQKSRALRGRTKQLALFLTQLPVVYQLGPKRRDSGSIYVA